MGYNYIITIIMFRFIQDGGEMNKFTVYGGCISRDVFNYLDKEKYIPSLTIGQNPISTMFDLPFNIELEDYVCGRNFDKRMLFYDANKLAVEKITKEDSKYFIFDIICERITVMEFALGNSIGKVEKSYTFIDNWYEFLKTPKYEGIKKIRDINTLDLDDLYEHNIDKFCKIISKKFKSNHIIFLELNLVDEYIDKDGKLKSFNKDDGYNIVSSFNMPEYGNAVLKRVQKRIKKQLPNIHYIPMPDSVLASSNHHFGLHPLHFTDDYYQYAATAVEMIVELDKPKLTKIPLRKLCDLQSRINKYAKAKLINF